MEIPKQLQDETFRFVLLGEWNKWKNAKTKNVSTFTPEEYPLIDKKTWKALGKAPYEKEWEQNGYKFNDEKLLNHQGNLGVIAGYGKLRILDIDNPKIAEELEKKIDTYTVKTGSGGRHFYFISDYDKNCVLANEVGEFRADNYQVVSALCKHPSGNYYTIIKDIPIQTISKEDLLALIKPYLREEKEMTIPQEMKGGDKKDTSRSGLEFRKVLSLLRNGKSREEIYKEMDAYSKWLSAPEQYKTLTFEKAENFYLQEQEEIKEKIESGEEELSCVISNYYGKVDLAKKILEIQPLYYDENKIWWAWRKKEFRWKIVDDTDILNFVRKLSKMNTVKAKEKGEILEALKQEARLNQPKKINETWVQFKDLIIDIKTGNELKASPEWFVTNPIAYGLHREKFVLTPTMDKIFEEWVGEKFVQTLYEIIAYCLIPDYPIHRLFCFIGIGLNGKSCFLRLLKKFIGENNVTSTELDTLLSSRFEVTRLHKKLVCMMGETDFSELSKTGIIKKLTGQDTIGFEYKNKNPFADFNYAKILIATNNLPATTDKTMGFYRRWCIIDFPNTFSEQKDILNEIPEEEYECLAVKSLILLKDLLDARKFHNEGTIEERTKKYEDKSNPLERFMKEFLSDDDIDGFVWKFEFEKRLNEWCKENRFRQISSETIGRMMKEKGFLSIYQMSDWLINGSHKQLRAWGGLKWK